MAKKLTYEFVKKQFEKRGWELVSKKYENSSTKLDYKCNNRHKESIRYNDFQQGKGCMECSRLYRMGKRNSNWRGGDDVAWYDIYAPQISFCEEVRRDPENKDYLRVRCTKCNKWFIPKRKIVQNRARTLKGIGRGENRFYCSEECKKECCIYNQKKYPKGFYNLEKYRKGIIYLTNKNYRKYKNIINPFNLKRREYELDHIYSIKDGFENSISQKIIASPINLRMLIANENKSKSGKSDFNILELYKLYNQFKEEIKNYE